MKINLNIIALFFISFWAITSCKVVDGTGFKGYGGWYVVEHAPGEYRLEIKDAAWGLKSRSYQGFVGIQYQRDEQEPELLASKAVSSINGKVECGLMSFVDDQSHADLSVDRLNPDGKTSYAVIFFTGSVEQPQVTCSFELKYLGLKRINSPNIAGTGTWYVLKTVVQENNGAMKEFYRPYIADIQYSVDAAPYIGTLSLRMQPKRGFAKIVDSSKVNFSSAGIVQSSYTWSNEHLQLSKRHPFVNTKKLPVYSLIFRERAFVGKWSIIGQINLLYGGVITEIPNQNTAPIADPSSLAVQEDQSAIQQLTGTDNDGDELTFELVTGPQNGQAIVAENGILTYTPNPNYNGADSLSFRVFDGTDYSASAVITIAVAPVNDAPVIASQNYSTAEDTVLTQALIATDVDGDQLIYEITGQAAHGSASINSEGVLQYTPNAHYFGTDQLQVRVFDGQVHSQSAQVNISVEAVNDKPVANAKGVTLDEDGEISDSVNGSDLEGSDLSYRIIASTTNGQLSFTQEGIFTYTPNPDFFGTDNFAFVVNDGELDSDQAAVSITVNPINDAPVVEMLAPETASIFEIGDDVSISFSVTDIDDDAVIVRVLNRAEVLATFDKSASTFVVSGLGEGEHDLRVDAHDGKTLSTSTLSKITIAAAPSVAFVYTERRIDESAGTLSIPLQLSRPSLKPVVATISITSSDAALNSDYSVSQSELIIPAGQVKAHFEFTVLDDDIEEALERIHIKIESATVASLGDYTECALDIIDDDGEAPSLTLVEDFSLVSHLACAVLVQDASGLDQSSLNVFLSQPDGERLDLIGNATVTANDDNNFRINIDRALSLDGAHNLSVSIADELGQVATLLHDFEVDVTAPVISDLSVTPASPASESLPTLSFHATDNRDIDRSSFVCELLNENADLLESVWDISIDEPEGEPLTVTARNTSGILNGIHSLRVRIKDEAGNESQQELAYIRDGIVPQIVFTDPLDRTWYSADQESVVIRGYVNELCNLFYINYGVTELMPAERNGQQVYTFEYEVDLKPGLNAYHATARDLLGNLGTANINFIVDDLKPQVHIESPADNQTFNVDTINIIGMVHDLVPGTVNARDVTVTVNGFPAVVENRTFMFDNFVLEEGTNEITATARDAAGNEVSHSISVRKGDIPGIQLSMISGNQQTVGIGQVLPQPLIVEAHDIDGNPLANRAVSCRVARGSGYFLVNGNPERNFLALTDANGRLAVSFTTGTRAGEGNNRVIIKPEHGVAQVEFVASVLPGPATGIHILEGTNQTFAANAMLPKPLKVWVSDLGGNPLRNASVDYTVVSGDATFTNGEQSITIQTNGDGRASAFLRTGSITGLLVNTIEARVRGYEDDFRPAKFEVTVRELGDLDDTAFSGLCLDATGRPAEGTLINFMGTSISTVVDAEGFFKITGMPVGTHHLSVDGRTADIPNLPDMEYEIEIVPGIENSLPYPLYLPAMDEERKKLVGGPTETELELRGVEGHKIIIHPNSLILPDGTRGQAEMVFSQVNTSTVPMPAPGGLNPTLMTSLMPHGIKFDPPATVVMPNTEGLPAGFQTEYMAFDHDLGQFVTVGTATVSEDRSVITTDPGTGLIKAGWHGNMGLPPPTGVVENGKPERPKKSKDPKCSVSYVSVTETHRTYRGKTEVVSNGDPMTVVLRAHIKCDEGASFVSSRLAWSIEVAKKDSDVVIVDRVFNADNKEVTLTVEGLSADEDDFIKVVAFYNNKGPRTKEILMVVPAFDIQLEAPWAEYTKAVVLNDGDVDIDGVPDFADGFISNGSDGTAVDFDHAADDASFKFVPLHVRIPPTVDISQARILFQYRDASPTSLKVNRDDPENPTYTPDTDDGTIRIWKKDGTFARNTITAAQSDGDYIYSLEPMLLTQFIQEIDEVYGAEFTLYVEGCRFTDPETGPAYITAMLDVDGDAVIEVEDGRVVSDKPLKTDAESISVIKLEMNAWEIAQLEVKDVDDFLVIQGVYGNERVALTRDWNFGQDYKRRKHVIFVDPDVMPFKQLRLTEDYTSELLPSGLRLKAIGALFPSAPDDLTNFRNTEIIPFEVIADNISDQLRRSLSSSVVLNRVQATLKVLPEGSHNNAKGVWYGQVATPPYGPDTIIGARGRIKLKSPHVFNADYLKFYISDKPRIDEVTDGSINRGDPNAERVVLHGMDSSDVKETSFIVSGHELGASMFTVAVDIAGRSGLIKLLEKPVPVDPLINHEPQAHQLAVATRNAGTHKQLTASGLYLIEDLSEKSYEDSLELFAQHDKIAGTTYEQAGPFYYRFMGEQVHAALYRASQIIPLRNNDGLPKWDSLFNRPAVSGLNPTGAKFADESDSRLYFGFRDFLKIWGHNADSRVLALEELTKRFEQYNQSNNIWERRISHFVPAQSLSQSRIEMVDFTRKSRSPSRAQVIRDEMRAKDLLNRASIARVKQHVALDKGPDEMLDEIAPQILSLPEAEREEITPYPQDLETDQINNISKNIRPVFPEEHQINWDVNLRITDWWDGRSLFGFDKPLSDLLEMNVSSNWSISHPFTEELVGSMIAERVLLIKGLMQKIEADIPKEDPRWPFNAAVVAHERERLLGSIIIYGDPEVPNDLKSVPVNFDGDTLTFRPVESGKYAGFGPWVNRKNVLEDRLTPKLGIAGSLPSTIPFRYDFIWNNYYDNEVESSPLFDKGTQLYYRFHLFGNNANSPQNKYDVAACIIMLALDEVAILNGMLQDKVRQEYWQNFEQQYGTFAYTAMSVGIAVFGLDTIALSWYGVDFVSGEPLSALERTFYTGLAAISVFDIGGVSVGAKRAMISTANASKRMAKTSLENARKFLDGDTAKALSEGLDDIAEIGDLATTSLRGGSNVRRLDDAAADLLQATDDVPSEVYDLTRYRMHMGITDTGPGSLAGTGTLPSITRLGKRMTSAGEVYLNSSKHIVGRTFDNAVEIANELNKLNKYEQAIFKEVLEKENPLAAMLAVKRFQEKACFVAGTSVLMHDGRYENIEDVKVNEFVATRSQFDSFGYVQRGRVIGVLRKSVNGIRRLRLRMLCLFNNLETESSYKFNNNTKDIIELNTTDAHPFWSLDLKKWVPAEKLTVGSKVRGLDCDWIVESHKNINEPTTVYNISVEGAHTYFVTDLSTHDAGEVWVHNDCVYAKVMDSIPDNEVAEYLGKTVDDISPTDRLRYFEDYVDTLPNYSVANPGFLKGNKDIGAWGEWLAEDLLKSFGWDVGIPIRNASDNGIDIIARSSDGKWGFFEVKTTTVGKIPQLSKRQRNMNEFLEDILGQAASPTGGTRYRNLTQAQRDFADDALDAFRSDPDGIISAVIGVDLDAGSILIRDWRP